MGKKRHTTHKIADPSFSSGEAKEPVDLGHIFWKYRKDCLCHPDPPFVLGTYSTKEGITFYSAFTPNYPLRSGVLSYIYVAHPFEFFLLTQVRAGVL
jgi:hypothetical protein